MRRAISRADLFIPPEIEAKDLETIEREIHEFRASLDLEKLVPPFKRLSIG